MPKGKPQLTLTVHHRSDTGRVRDHNEDYVGYRQPEGQVQAEAGWLYAVADGVGGARAGEIASKLAVQTLLATYYDSTQEMPADRLREAFTEANRAVYDRASEQGGLHHMGTTLVAAVVRDRELIVSNVGDSRAYLIHDEQIRQITHDHTIVARLVDEGVITPEEAENHPRRHIISRSIGGHSEVDTDIFCETFLPGDCLLLCSDGLTEYVTDAEILAAMQSEDPEDGVQNLVDVANERGGQDNITILAVRALREREDRLPPLTLPPETEKAPVSRRLSWPWIGVIVAGLLIVVAGLAATALGVFKPTPTPTPTATFTPLPPLAAPTATGTAIPTPTPLPTAADTATPQPTETPVPTVTAESTETPVPSHTPTVTPLPTEPETVLPTATETSMPALTPTPTDTSESSPLATPTPTHTLTLMPTPTSTTEGSPLPTPTS